MNNKPKLLANASRSWPEALAIVFSMLAIVISAYSLVAARQQHEDERSSEMLDALFEDWDNLSAAMAGDWEVSYLGEPPETYYEARDLLRQSLAGLSNEEKLRVLTLERVYALRIFAMFEHSQKQWQLAVKAGDATRLGLMNTEMDFWTRVQLRNPRLLWYWSEDGGGGLWAADEPTIPFYNARVLNDPDYPLTYEPDPEGVVPGVAAKASTPATESH
jgi:hypothetical protein